MPIHRNDPCPCLSGKAHKFCCRNTPQGVSIAGKDISRMVAEANSRALPRRERRSLCRAIAKRIPGVSARQVFQPHAAQGVLYGDCSKAQSEHHKRKANRLIQAVLALATPSIFR